MPELKAGDKAPEIELQNQDGETVSLAQFAGQKVLVYFYPRASTPGCTTQSCAVRDATDNLTGLHVAAIGISPDKPAAQRKFDDKYELGFPLLCDTDHAVAKAYDVWREKSKAGKTYMGILRSAFLIDESGTIQEAWYQVSPKETVPNVMAALGA